MKQTRKIQCPKCNTVQSQDIDELAMDAGEMEGEFPHICEKCTVEFNIEFSYKPYVRTYL